MGAEFAMALADLIRVGELRRLKICAATANMLRLTANGARRTGNVGRRGFEPA
jgi:hypothetical protein